MAMFCTKCGASLPTTTGFCPACGTPIGSPVASPPAAAAPPPAVPAPAPAYAQPAYAAPPPKSGGALKIILIVIAVVVGLGVLAVAGIGFTAWRVARTISTDSKGNVSALGGAFSAGKDLHLSEADLGVPLYPGATTGEGGMHMNLPNASIVTAVYVTSDPVDTVTAFYKGKLGANEADTETGHGSVLTSGRQGADGKSGIEITIGPGSGNNAGKTQIVIVHTVSTQ